MYKVTYFDDWGPHPLTHTLEKNVCVSCINLSANVVVSFEFSSQITQNFDYAQQQKIIIWQYRVSELIYFD